MSLFGNNSFGGGNNGGGASNFSQLTDFETTITPTDGNLLSFNSSTNKWKPISSKIYTIELGRWGITQGLPTKPYQTSDYTTANNNITGINNALSWAYQNGYDYVVFPRGSYSICYNPSNIITTQPYMTIDFNASTFKVMYDSDNRSPYDVSSNPTYNFGGDAIRVTTPYTHITNLILIGDRIDRSWTNLANERLMESTNGVKFGAGANFSSIRYSNISYFMGDAIALYYSPYTTFPTGGFTIEAGSLSSTGATVTAVDSTSVRSSSFITIPSGLKSFSMIGLGYSPQTSIPNKTYNVYFYKSDGTFIFAKTNVRTRDMVQIPKDAIKLKLSWEGYIDSSLTPASVSLNGGSQNTTPYWVVLINNSVADSIIVEFNEIHRNHRGGLFLGTNNAVIRKNFFHDTGSPDGMDIDGLPQFVSSTRYAIDTEDNVGQHCRILDNVFDNVRMAMCLRGEYNEVSGNEIRNCPYGVEVYNLNHIIINNNYFYYSSIMCYPYDSVSRDWRIGDNVFNASNFNFTGSGTFASANNNYFLNGSTVSNYVRPLSFKHNVFDGSKFSFVEYNTVIDSCSFINSSSISIVNTGRNLDNNIIRCNFSSSSFILSQATPQVTVRDSVFSDGLFKYASSTGTFVASNCIFNNPTKPVIRANDINGAVPNSIGITTCVLDLENCTVNLGVPNNPWKASTVYSVGDIVFPKSGYNGFYYQCTTYGVTGATEPIWSTTIGNTVTSGGATFTTYQVVKVAIIYGFNWGNLILNNTKVQINNYVTYTTALLDYYGDFTGMIQIQNSSIMAASTSASNNASKLSALKIDSKSVLTNFSLTGTIVETQSDMMTNAPTTGTFTLCQTIGNKNPVSGGYLGWVCITAGTANNSSWTTGTAYVVGKQVNNGGNVYECTTAGTAGAIAPTGTGTGISDGGATWKYVNPLAAFKQYGLIQ